METSCFFHFKLDISGIDIPTGLNNPFSKDTPLIAQKAAEEFQVFLTEESKKWEHDFENQKGKMFGVLVVQKADLSYGYLAAVSGKLPNNVKCDRLTPSVFDESTDDYFINKGMTELTALSLEINRNPERAEALTEQRKQKSIALQQRLFENYRFQSLSGKLMDVLEIFHRSQHGPPPAAAGECAAPKLINYALQHKLTPIAIAEFWWGKSPKSEARTDQSFYPSCKNKCRPILEFMLEDSTLFEIAQDQAKSMKKG